MLFHLVFLFSDKWAKDELYTSNHMLYNMFLSSLIILLEVPKMKKSPSKQFFYKILFSCQVIVIVSK